MKGGKRRASVDPPPPPLQPEPTAEDGGEKCGEDDQSPPLPPPSIDVLSEVDRQKKPEKGASATAAEGEGAAVAAATEEEEEEEDGEEEEGEGEKGNDHFKDLEIEEGEGEEGDGEGERPKLAEGFYEIEAVRRKRVRKGQVQYLIKWREWPETANTWEPLENFLSCADVIDAFEESLVSGKRSARKRKRKYGSTQSQTKKKQQQRSPAAATYNVPAVKVRIIEKPLPFPPLNDPCITNGEASICGLNNIEKGKKVNENGVKIVTYRADKMEEQNELDLKISELKGATAVNEDCVDKFTVDSQEAQSSGQGGVSDGWQKADGAEPFQSGRFIGARRRKSGSVKRFKQDVPSGMTNDSHNAGAVNGSMNQGSQCPDSMANDLRCKNKVGSSRNICDITEIIKPVSYSSSMVNNIQDVSVTFMAKRSDGKEVTVDNKFLKANHPVLLINYYEKHLRYSPA